MTPTISGTTNNKIRTYPITPDTKLFENLGATGQPAYKAIAEFTDNSVDNRITNERVTVNINYTQKNNKITKITIEDDASGMTEEDLVKAFTIGHSSKTGSKKIGRFGMGMKTAISALGNSWTITTATSNCKVAHQISDNKSRLTNSNQWTVDVTDVPKIMPINKNYGTLIEIRDTEKLNATTFSRDLERNLGNLFRHFINDGTLTLTINDNIIEAPEYEIIDKSVKELNTVINGKTVRGWIGLRVNGNVSYGFSLVRNNRVMEEEVKLGFQPHPSVNRIVGDIHLDDFDTDHHKTSFNKNTDEWATFLDYISTEVKPLVDYARSLSHRDNSNLTPLQQKKLNETLKTFLDAIKSDDLLNQINTGGTIEDDGTITGRSEESRNAPSNVDTNRKRNDSTETSSPPPKKIQPYNNLKIEWQCLNDGPGASRKRWEVYEGTLMVTINTDHPTWAPEAPTLSWVFQNIMESVAGYHAYLRSAERGDNSYSTLEDYEDALDRMYRIAATNNLVY